MTTISQLPTLSPISIDPNGYYTTNAIPTSSYSITPSMTGGYSYPTNTTYGYGAITTIPLTGTGLHAGSTITVTGGGLGGYGSGSTFTISGLNPGDINTTIKFPEEWVDKFPDFNRIKKMCEEYPALQIAFEKFKTVYSLVKDHYDTPEDKRPLP